MNLLEHVRVASAVAVYFSVPGHPELSRVIELPENAPSSWAVDAYLLAVGITGDRPYEDTDVGIRIRPSAWSPYEPQALTIPEVPHPIDVYVRPAPRPAFGDPCVCVVSASDEEEGPTTNAWHSGRAPFRAAHVNHELLRTFGVVLPYIDESRFDSTGAIPGDSLLAMLLRSVSTVRRIALRAHLDDIGLLVESPRDLGIVESATASIRTLLGYVGTEGLAQDSETGWFRIEDSRAIAKELEWSEAESDAERSTADELLALAQRWRLVRRLNGRIVGMKQAHKLVEPSVRTIGLIAQALVSSELSRSYGSYRRNSYVPPEVALVLVAVADGSAKTIAELPALVALGVAALEPKPRYGYDAEYDYSYDFKYQDPPPRREVVGISPAAQTVIDSLSALAGPGHFGVISPAMREVAKVALL